MQKVTTFKDYQERVKRAYLLIAGSLEQPVDIALLAKEAAFSFYHFHRIYRAIVGETVVETHRRLRLERAAGRLVYSRFSITRIALEAGYETPQAFTRAFKSRFIYSPSEYRKKGLNHNDFQCGRGQGLLYPPAIMETIKMNITVEQRPSITVFAMRHTGPYPEIAKTFNELWQWVCSEKRESQAKSGLCIYYDDPVVTPAEQCRADTCVELEQPYPEDSERIRRVEIPAGTYARYRHVGSYSMLGQAYEALCGQWLSTSGYEAANAPPFEIYVNNPYDTPEEQLITDIYIQVIDK